jgi:hypothetical protein
MDYRVVYELESMYAPRGMNELLGDLTTVLGDDAVPLVYDAQASP